MSETHVIRRQPISRQSWAVIGVFGILGALGFWFGMIGHGIDAETFPLVVDPEDRDFGEAWMQEEFRWQLPIRNTSSRTVEVLDFNSSCGCTSVSPASFVIAPGGTRHVNLTLDTSGGWKEGNADRAQGFSIVLSPVVRRPGRSRGRWVIKGRVRRPLAFSPPEVLFGETLLHGEPLPEHTVLVSSSASLEALRIECDSPYVRVASRACESEETGQFALTLAPGEQELPVGRFEIEVMVTGVLAGGEELPAVPLRIAGLVVSDIYAIPDVIRFTRDAVGQESMVEVVLQSRVEGEFEVEQVMSDGDDLNISPRHSGSNRIHTIRVSRNQRSDDNPSRRLTFVVRTESGRRKHIDVGVGKAIGE